MQRHILNKRKPSCTHISPRVTLQVLKSKEKPWESYEKTPQKQPLRKIIQKKLGGRRLPTNYDRRRTIRNKIHKNESKLLKQNLQGGKRFITICDTIPTLSVYYKGSLNNKNGILYKANHNFNKSLKNHQLFPYKKGKSLKDMLVRAKKRKGLITKGSQDVRYVTCCIFSHNRFVSILAIIPAGCVLYNNCGQLSR